MTNKTFQTIQEATFFAVKQTGALRVSRTTDNFGADGIILQSTGFDFFGNPCFNIYKLFTNQFSQAYIVRFKNK